MLARWLVAITIFGVTGELLARATNLVDRLNGYGRSLYVAGPGPDLPYRLRPGVQTTYVGAPVRVNALGFRGPEVAVTPAPGVRRILVLGDSVVFGQGVREDETVSAVVARSLASRTAPVEVINAGVPGYDTTAELRLLALAGMPLHPSSVVVGMSLNDYDPAPAYSPIGVLSYNGSLGVPLLDASEFVMLLRWLWRWTRGSLGYQVFARIEQGLPNAGPTTGVDRLVENEHRRFYAAPPPDRWQRVVDACAALAAFGKEHALPILVAIFPEQWQVRPDADVTPQRALLDVCRRTGLTCLDLQPAFAAAGGTLFQDAQHPNAAGHAVAGAVIAAALRGS